MARLGFIGSGHMTRAMVRYLAPKGHEIWVTHRGQEVSEALSADFENVTATTVTEVIDTAEIVFLCLRPDVARTALLGHPFRADQHVVSVMAGISRDDLLCLCAPVQDITLMLPMELIERGGCPIAIWPGDAVVSGLFEPGNTVINLPDEAALAACFAATTLVSAVAETLDAGTEWLMDRIGTEAAQTYIGQMIPGMLAIHAGQAHRFAALRDSLATPGTLNLAMIEALRSIGLSETVRSKLDDLGG